MIEIFIYIKEQIYESVSYLTGRYPILLSAPSRAAMTVLMVILLILLVGKVSDLFEKLFMRITTNLFGSLTSYILTNYVTFPGTVIHELSHAMVALLTGAKVTKIVIFEKPGTDRLGHVEFIPSKGFIRKSLEFSLISCAPTFINTFLAVLCVLGITRINGSGTKALLIYLAISFFVHAGMSSKDLENFIKGIIPTYLTAVLMTSLVLYMKGINI